MLDRVATYTDDFTVFLQTWEEYLVQLKEVFERLIKISLARAEKCTIEGDKCSFLGHKIGSGCVKLC